MGPIVSTIDDSLRVRVLLVDTASTPLEVKMPVKPNGALCAIREQIVEDLASGLILQIECHNGRTRLVIAGRALPFGNREIIFDSEGKEAAAGTLVGEFRRPSWLKRVP
jgi:hypothetical protein